MGSGPRRLRKCVAVGGAGGPSRGKRGDCDNVDCVRKREYALKAGVTPYHFYSLPYPLAFGVGLKYLLKIEKKMFFDKLCVCTLIQRSPNLKNKNIQCDLRLALTLTCQS